MGLSKNLLFTDEEFKYKSTLDGTSIKGSYNTMQFVLRLRDDIKKALEKTEIDSETLQAISTSIHENIHWWQHIGSNFGFLYSLAYPAFAHISKNNFDKLIAQNIKVKSILKFDKEYYEQHGKTDIPDLNIILNNYYDLEYAKSFAISNKSINEIQKDRRFFLYMGHCYAILWAATIETISSAIDPNFSFLPNTDNWIPIFKKLNDQKIQGFFIDTSMVVSPIGIKAIYEGQAIFNQMLYLTITLNNDLTFQDFEDVGMLYGIYSEAFDYFLQITGIQKPESVIDPIVGLFLLVCDLSINPNNGFPLDIYDFENFINKNDPGIRFFLFCYKISEDAGEYLKELKKFSKEEYISLSKKLSENIGCVCSYESIKDVLNWSEKESVDKILSEEQEMKFSKENLSIRLMFSKYYRFQEDKFKYPHVFCWFGLYARGGSVEVKFDIVDSLYQKHHALFIEDFDGEIKPVLFKGVKEENIEESFNSFYNFNILYDLILKWVYEEGEFKLDYKWLVNKRADDYIPIVEDYFERLFGITMNQINIL